MSKKGVTDKVQLGGATARIGDPTDRLKEREKVHRATRKANMVSMHAQLKMLGELIERHAKRRGYHREWAWRRALVNNSTWYQKLPLLEFLQTMGAAARIGPMLGRDTSVFYRDVLCRCRLTIYQSQESHGEGRRNVVR